MTNTPILSIITVNKNNCRGLERTLSSINFIRERPEIELIFVDGGSDDESLVIAKKFYDDENVITGPDSGIYHGMNRGLSRARGKYSLFLNSGDEIIPDNFDAVVSIIQDSTYDVISFNSLMIKEGCSRVYGVYKMNLPTTKNSLFSIPHQSTIYKSRCLKEAGAYLAPFRSAGDYELNHRLFFCTRASFGSFDLPLSRFYLGGTSSETIGSIENLIVEYMYERRSLFSILIRLLKKATFWKFSIYGITLLLRLKGSRRDCYIDTL